MMTLSKLAKLANVSVSTASKAFAGSPEVNRETGEMIFSVAKAHGCFKKFYNVKYPKLVIALIAPEFQSGLYVRYLSLLQQELEAQGCELCVSTTNFSREREQELLEYYYRHANVDGILIIGMKNVPGENYEIPVVALCPSSPVEKGICTDLLPAFRESLAYLKGKGVRSIGFIGEELTAPKEQQFRMLMEEARLPLDPNLIVRSGRQEQGGYDAMERLFAENRLPRAVICAYDRLALGAIRCILDHGLSVPEDIAVLGMDDMQEAPWLNPPLASISASVEAICRLAAETVLKKISGEDVPETQNLPAQFHLRRSFEID